MNDRCGQTWQVWWDQASPTTLLFLRSFVEGKLPANTFAVVLSLGGKRAVVLDSDHPVHSSQVGQETSWRWLLPAAAKRIA